MSAASAARHRADRCARPAGFARAAAGDRLPLLVLAPSLASRASSTSSSSPAGRSTFRCRTPSLLPTYGFVGLEHYVVAVGQPALEHRLHQPLSLQRLLRRRRDGDRTAARHPDRPARARRGGLAHDLPLSARRLLRRHRHGVELALQPDLRHRVVRARPRLDRLQVRAGPPTATSRSTRSSSPASGRPRASPWRCSWPGCARSTRTSSRRRRSTAPACARIYRRVVMPAIAPIFIAVLVVLLQFAIKTFDLVAGADRRRPGHLDHLPRHLRLRPDVPARPDRRGCGGGDHDPARARRRAGPLFAVDQCGAGAGRAGHG